MASSRLFEASSEVFQTVLKSFGTTEKALNEDVKQLQEWMKSQKYFPEIMDSKMLRNFLILNKCDLEKTKSKVDMYYTVRGQVPEVYERSNPKKPIMKKLMEAIYYIPLPQLTEDKCRVFLYKTRNQTLMDDLDPYDIIAHLMSNLFEIRMREDVAFMDIIIIDCEDISLKYLTKVTPMMIFHFIVSIYQRVYSFRMKALYFINAPLIVEKIMLMFKSVLKPAFFERIHMCHDSNILKEEFPIKILPRDYGGEELPLEELRDMVVLKLKEHQGRFDELDKLRIDEKLRPRAENNGFFEIYKHNNFKNLEID